MSVSLVGFTGIRKKSTFAQNTSLRPRIAVLMTYFDVFYFFESSIFEYCQSVNPHYEERFCESNRKKIIAAKTHTDGKLISIHQLNMN
jgi:hypothetical protein